MPRPTFYLGKKYIDYYAKFNQNLPFNSVLHSVDNAIKNVSHYRDLYQKNKITSKLDFENSIQFVNKKILIEQREKLMADHFDHSTYELTTTGSTTSASPTAFYVRKDRYKKEFAYFHKIWSTLGYNYHFRGVIRNTLLPKNKDFKINPFTKEIIFDGFRNDSVYYKKIYKILKEHKIKYLQCYPSSAYSFFLFLNEQKLDFSFIKGVFLSSEMFLPIHKNLLVDKLKLAVISVYGHGERVCLAVDYNGDNKYKIIENYGYFELVDKHNNIIKEIGVQGEIVGTTIDNFGMPLIRFKTGDLSSYHEYNEQTNTRILNGIYGRIELKIFNNDGTYITPTALNLHDDLYLYIKGFQYYQKEKGKLVVRIIPNELYNAAVEIKFLQHFKNRLKEGAFIEIIKVNELEKDKKGKFTMLISEVN